MINGCRYMTVLKQHLLPLMRIHRCTWFLQDGTPCHKAEVVMAKLQEMEKEFHVMDWPGNMPDLNPIKNCWAYMKAKLKMNSAITSLPKLVEAIKLMWVRDLPLDYFQSLSSSMPCASRP